MDSSCRIAYEQGAKSSFIVSDIEHVDAADISSKLGKNSLTLMAGCAPCQPFSSYSRGKRARKGEDRWQLLSKFSSLVEDVKPDFVTMENVLGILNHKVFNEFIKNLQSNGYRTNVELMRGPDFGLPQTRRRVVVLASRHGWVELLKPEQTESGARTVKEAIGHLPRLAAGERCGSDPMHKSAGLSELSLKRIRASKPGGTWLDWPESLRAQCHQALERPSYISVYGRMDWDKPSPTITTQFYGYGTGRFGHPDQDRAITPREAAILQGFPEDYKFFEDDTELSLPILGRMIGNAVPVPFGRAIGRSFHEHARRI